MPSCCDKCKLSGPCIEGDDKSSTLFQASVVCVVYSVVDEDSIQRVSFFCVCLVFFFISILSLSTCLSYSFSLSLSLSLSSGFGFPSVCYLLYPLHAWNMNNQFLTSTGSGVSSCIDLLCFICARLL